VVTSALDEATPVEAYWASRPVDMMDKANALPASRRAGWDQVLGSTINSRNHLNFTAKLSNQVGPAHPCMEAEAFKRI
jgi:hypothetical protein